ncbi:MAG: stage II sporulation protein R [Bacilli bacterium]
MVKFRNSLFILIISFIIIIVCNGCTSNKDTLRLRILANSNSEIDQANKLEVKEVVKLIYEENPNIGIQELEQMIKERINKDYKQTIKVEYRNESFPAKSYNQEFIPSGTYPTIVITIGEGKGKNFWTLLYPDFFNISFEDDNEIEYRSYFYDHLNK